MSFSLLLSQSNFIEPSKMPFSRTEFRLEERLDKVPGYGRPYRPPSNANNVDVIVFDSLASREMIVNQCRANTGNLIGTNRCPDTAAADCDAALNLA
jgi:hypothetical protein